jgi:hypothetical protein
MNIGAPSKSCPHLHRSNGNTVRVMQKCESALQHVSCVPKRPPKNEPPSCCIDTSPMPNLLETAFPRYMPKVGPSDDSAVYLGIFISNLLIVLGFMVMVSSLNASPRDPETHFLNSSAVGCCERREPHPTTRFSRCKGDSFPRSSAPLDRPQNDFAISSSPPRLNAIST